MSGETMPEVSAPQGTESVRNHSGTGLLVRDIHSGNSMGCDSCEELEPITSKGYYFPW